MDRQLSGRRAEDIAADFLRGRGLEIIERNYRRRNGELDVVAREKDVLVIAEVRTRASDEFGGAAASIDGWKQRCIVRAAQQLLQQRKELAKLRARFDVLVVSDIEGPEPKVEWIRHAFDAN